MNISQFALRVLTVFAYTLPLVFCVSTCGSDGNLRFAFNKTHAITNEEEARNFNFFMVDSAFTEVYRNHTQEKFHEVKEGFKNNPVYNEKLMSLKKDAFYRLKWPTDASISAIGVFEMKVLFDNEVTHVFVVIVLALSVLLSVFSLLLWRKLIKWKWTLYILVANSVLILGFMLYCLLNGITMLYGTWLLLFLLVMQLLSEIQDKFKKPLQVSIPASSENTEVPNAEAH